MPSSDPLRIGHLHYAHFLCFWSKKAMEISSPRLTSRHKFSSEQTFQTKIISDKIFQTEINPDQTFQTQITSDQIFQAQRVCDQNFQTESVLIRPSADHGPDSIQTIAQTLIRL